MQNQSAARNPVTTAGGTISTANRPRIPQKIARPTLLRSPTVQFQEIQVGQFFEFRGHRYRKLALKLAGDEERNGVLFQAYTEVLPDPIAGTGFARSGGCEGLGVSSNCTGHL
jgi:hypothetical protein